LLLHEHLVPDPRVVVFELRQSDGVLGGFEPIAEAQPQGTGAVSYAAPHPHNPFVLARITDGEVVIESLSADQEVQWRSTEVPGGVQGGFFTNDGQTLVVWSTGHALHLFDVPTELRGASRVKAARKG
jgi:hypothetical protein